MRLLIADDEAPSREALSQLVSLYYPQAEMVGVYADVESAIEAINLYKPDVVLLDIEMGKRSGFDVIKHFSKPFFKPIFITAYQHYAIEAFRFAALDYLLKPVDPVLLQEALAKASAITDLEKLAVKLDSFMYNRAHDEKSTRRMVLKTTSDIHVVEISNIMYCKADHNYTTFYLQDKKQIMVSTTLGDYEELLKDLGFIRIHQSYLLNICYLSRYEKGEGGHVILKDNTSLPVATRKKEHFLQWLAVQSLKFKR